MRSRPIARRAALLALVTTGVLLGWAGSAYAVDQVDFSPNGLTFSDDPNEASTLTITASQTSITFAQTGDNIDADTGSGVCTGDGTPTVTCDVATFGIETFSYWNAFMDDLVDTVTANGSLGGSINGENGADVLTGSNENGTEESLNGGDDNDQIDSRNVGPRLPGSGGIFSAGGDGFCCFGFGPVGDIVQGGYQSDVITTGNGNDHVDGDPCCVFTPLALKGANPDLVGTDVISTGAGDDSADGRGGNGDQVTLGEGDDLLFEGGNHGTGDTFDGGPGLDFIELYNLTGPSSETVFTPDNYTLDLATGAASRTNNGGGSDTAVNFEDALTDIGNDVVNGTDGSNLISTPSGSGGGGIDSNSKAAGADGGAFTGTPPPDNDTVNGLGGADGIDVGNGNDTVEARDGFQDRVQCGAGADTVNADQFDILSLCEAVTIEERRAAGADIAAPDCKLSKVKGSYSRTAFFRGFNITVACNEGATLVIRLLASLKKGLFAKAGDVVLAEKTVQLTGASRTTKLKPSKKVTRRLRKKGFKGRVEVEARDQYGNRSLEQKSLKVKKPKAKKKKK